MLEFACAESQIGNPVVTPSAALPGLGKLAQLIRPTLGVRVPIAKH